jgi:NAD(P)H-dependent FMN reductase
MAARIFSTEDTVYCRVQAGIVAAASALLASSSGSKPSGTSSSGGGGGGGSSREAWRRVLRGLQVEALAPEVYRLAASVYRIAAVSAAVAGPPIYAPLLAHLAQEQAQQ